MHFRRREYADLRRSYNPGVGKITHNSLRVDPTELGNPLRELLRADDQWAHIPAYEGTERPLTHVKTKGEIQIEEEVVKHAVEGNHAAFIRERMLNDQCPMEERYQRASKEVMQDCLRYMRQLEMVRDIASHAGGRVLGPKLGDGFTTWGERIPLVDCEAQRVSIGNLRFRAIAFGDTIRLSERSRIITGPIVSQERNQCVLLHAAAGAQ